MVWFVLVVSIQVLYSRFSNPPAPVLHRDRSPATVWPRDFQQVFTGLQGGIRPRDFQPVLTGKNAGGGENLARSRPKTEPKNYGLETA